MSRRCNREIAPDVHVRCTLDPDEDKEAFCEVISTVVADDAHVVVSIPMSKAEARKLAEHILRCLEVSA